MQETEEQIFRFNTQKINLLRITKKVNKFRYYKCSNCGYSAYAVDKALKVTCSVCKTLVETKPVPEIKKSNLGPKEGLKVS